MPDILPSIVAPTNPCHGVMLVFATKEWFEESFSYLHRPFLSKKIKFLLELSENCCESVIFEQKKSCRREADEGMESVVKIW